MADKTKIEWTDTTWNPIVGCSVVSPGCTNCYAMRMAGTRLKNTPAYIGLTQDTKAGPVWNGKVRFLEKRLEQPLRWAKPRRVFVNSMSDLFHEDSTDEWIDQMFAVMALTPQHTYQILTKRPHLMQLYFGPYAADRIYLQMKKLMTDWPDVAADWMLSRRGAMQQYQANLETVSVGAAPKVVATREIVGWPLRNVWLGTSVEDQTRADERIPALLGTPAVVRFLSVEPMIGPVQLNGVGRPWLTKEIDHPLDIAVDWVICGGESGPNRRHMEEAWARDLRAQCSDAGVAFFMKQMTGKEPIPPDLMIREFPN